MATLLTSFPFQLSKVLYVASRQAACLAAITLVASVVLYFVLPMKREMVGRCAQGQSAAIFSVEHIGEGPLALQRFALSDVVALLKPELELIAKNTRPDARGMRGSVWLSLSSSKEKRVLNSGQVVYLEEREGTGFGFAPAPTPLWIRPQVLEGGSVFLECGRITGEKGEFLLEEKGLATQEKACATLLGMQEAKFWAEDLFVQQFGGSEMRSLMGKWRIEVAADVYYVSRGDYLSYVQDHWKVVSEEAIAADAPLVWVQEAGAQGCILKMWDERGFFPKVVELRQETRHSQSEVLPTGFKMRTPTQISCQLGKRRAIVKVGDWLLKTARGWRTLKRSSEIDDYVAFRLRGELFCIESLEKQPGKMVLKMRKFNEMRTDAQEIQAVIALEKAKRPKEQKL